MTNRQTNFLSTDNLALASAILAMGIPLQTEALKIQKDNGKTKYVFLFEDSNEDGDVKTNDLIKAWNDPDFPANNTEDPFAFIICAFRNREKMLDELKQHKGYLEVKEGGRIALVSKDATAENVQELFKK